MKFQILSYPSVLSKICLIPWIIFLLSYQVYCSSFPLYFLLDILIFQLLIDKTTNSLTKNFLPYLVENPPSQFHLFLSNLMIILNSFLGISLIPVSSRCNIEVFYSSWCIHCLICSCFLNLCICL